MNKIYTVKLPWQGVSQIPKSTLLYITTYSITTFIICTLLLLVVLLLAWCVSVSFASGGFNSFHHFFS